MDCSKTIDFFPELKRLCNSRTACEAVNASDEHCPMLDYCADSLVTQRTEEIAKAIESLQKWSDEHPNKTYTQDFFEKFPKAQSNSDGTPLFVCKKRIYDGTDPTSEDCDYTGACKKCWNEPMEE